MATTFRRVSTALTSVNPSGQVVYTVPAATTTLGLSLLVSYVGTGSTAFVNAQVSGVDGEAFLVKEGEVQANSSLELIANKLVVASGDALILGASSVDSLGATFSYLELT
jgi:hypothetical protein|tara:strand:+ start:1952 stop:2281 length:330 start_codon:yes stop_codon:yes gene_type:complete